MRRRLDLAAALVARPPVLFLDEPTTGLDIRSRIGLWDAIEALVSEGTTVLLTTQYLDEADRLADRIAVIDQGLVIAEGTPDELKTQVGGERLEIHLCDGDRGEEAVVGSRLDRRATGRSSRTGPSASRCAERRGTIADAVRRLDEAGIAIDDIAVSTPTLDDVFLTLTGHAAEQESRGSRGGGPVTALRYGVSDTLVLARRSLLRIPRQPDLLVGFTVQPILFVLLFVYVFGGAIQTPGFDYVDFLMPGIIVQSICFGGFVTALGLVGRPEEGPDGPLPLAADDPLRLADRPHARRRRHERLPADRDARGRTARRLQLLGRASEK